VEKYVEAAEKDLSRGIILFASADDVWFARKVQMRLKSEFDWQREPNLTQLKELEIEFPKTGMISVQQNNVKVIDAFLNEIRDVQCDVLDVDTEDWSDKEGPGRGGGWMRTGDANYQEDKFKIIFTATQQRWYKSLAPELDKLAKDGNWKVIYLAGETEAVN